MIFIGEFFRQYAPYGLLACRGFCCFRMPLVAGSILVAIDGGFITGLFYTRMVIGTGNGSKGT